MGNKVSPITIRDVAERAKVSTSTVSRSLNDDPYISEATRERVLQAAKELGYEPNYWARALRVEKSYSVGIIIPDMVDDFFYKICDALIDALWEKGWMSVMAFSKENLEREKRIIRQGIKRKLDGFVMCVCDSTRNNEYFKSVIEESKIPIVFFDRVPLDFDAPTVNIDNEAAVHELTEHLIKAGYSKIAYIRNPSYMEYAQSRCRGYTQAIKKEGLSPQIYNCVDISIEAGRAVAETVIDHIDDIEAIIACDDFVAIGLMHELQRRGLNIPADIAIAGIGGSVLTSVVFPELTTIDYPKEEIGRQLAQMLIDTIHKRNRKNEHVTVRPIIRYRASTERGC